MRVAACGRVGDGVVAVRETRDVVEEAEVAEVAEGRRRMDFDGMGWGGVDDMVNEAVVAIGVVGMFGVFLLMRSK